MHTTQFNLEATIAIAGSVIAKFITLAIVALVSEIDPDIAAMLKDYGNGAMIAFWAGILLGWKLRGQRIRKAERNGTKSNRPEGEGTSTGSGSPVAGRSPFDNKGESMRD